MLLNLYNILLESIEYDKLIEEGKDPKEVLHYKFQNIPSNIIDKIINIDPTKKKTYSQWVLSHWIDEKDLILKSLENGRLEKVFQHFKEHQDIQIKDCPSLERALNYIPEEDSVLTKSTEPKTYLENIGRWVDSDLANDFEIVFDEDNWLIAVPHTYEADCKLGENTYWCTAGGRGDTDSYFNNYLRQGGAYL